MASLPIDNNPAAAPVAEVPRKPKRRIFRKICGILVLFLVIFAIIIACQPGSYSVSRSTTISAAPEIIYAQINDFHNWQAWSPWAKIDPAMKTTYEGAAAGPGAIYTWSGNDQVGEGRMTILESKSHTSVKIQLDFIRPFPATSTITFTLQHDNGDPLHPNTAVTWAMAGDKNFMAKAFQMFMPMEKIIGPDFEKGLGQLKTVGETANRELIEGFHNGATAPAKK